MRLFVCTLILTMLICSVAYGYDSRQMQFFFADENIVDTEFESTVFLFFSEIEFTNDCKGDIVIVGGAVKFSGNVSGNVYALFSKVESDSEHISIYQISSATIFFLFTSIFQLLFSIAILFLNVRKQTQNATIAQNEWKQSAITGGYLIFAFISVIVIFVLSVVGIPIAVIAFLIVVFLSVSGQIPLSIAVGFLLLKKNTKRLHFFFYFIVGFIFIEILKLLPVIGWAFRFLVIPIFCMGILARSYVNLYITKKYYTTPFYNPHKVEPVKKKLAGYDILHKKSKSPD